MNANKNPTRVSTSLSRLSTVKSSPKWSFHSASIPNFAMDTPGPGTYAFGGQDTSITSARHAQPLFGTASRDDSRPATVPGPGQYSPEKIQSRAKGIGFGSASRSSFSVPDELPGPGAYIVSKSLGSDGPKYSALRRRELTRTSDTPGPGQYSLSGESDALKKGVTPMWGFSKSARTPNNNVNVPGPGSYDYTSRTGIGSTGPKFSMRSKRSGFFVAKNETPGPGAHTGQLSCFD
eukprot:GEMP01023740.1.p1 GENE.GEMP01023740.1~~GEMP01023740.1.p1  ORF type:complete len:235 (+),score=31.35 GEMP01023740.1:384-1088(+)